MKRGASLAVITAIALTVLSIFLISAQSFSNDDKIPRISKIFPNNKDSTNGSDFKIRYTEDNMKRVMITFDGVSFNKTGCPSGRNVECIIPINISEYNGELIKYFFTVEDEAGNKGYSKKKEVFVDTKRPNITSFDLDTQNQKVRITVGFEEDNLKIVEYMDNSDSRSRWKRLCNHDENGFCFKRVTFRGNAPDITVRVTDDAGNFDILRRGSTSDAGLVSVSGEIGSAVV